MLRGSQAHKTRRGECALEDALVHTQNGSDPAVFYQGNNFTATANRTGLRFTKLFYFLFFYLQPARVQLLLFSYFNRCGDMFFCCCCCKQGVIRFFALILIETICCDYFQVGRALNSKEVQSVDCLRFFKSLGTDFDLRRAII